MPGSSYKYIHTIWCKCLMHLNQLFINLFYLTVETTVACSCEVLIDRDWLRIIKHLPYR